MHFKKRHEALPSDNINKSYGRIFVAFNNLYRSYNILSLQKDFWNMSRSAIEEQIENYLSNPNPERSLCDSYKDWRTFEVGVYNETDGIIKIAFAQCLNTSGKKQLPGFVTDSGVFVVATEVAPYNTAVADPCQGSGGNRPVAATRVEMNCVVEENGQTQKFTWPPHEAPLGEFLSEVILPLRYGPGRQIVAGDPKIRTSSTKDE